MFVSVGIYAICLALVLWGGKLPCKNKFHDDFLSLESTKALRGLAAFCILLHHISQEQIFQDKGVLSQASHSDTCNSFLYEHVTLRHL